MSTDANKRLIRQFIDEVINARNLGVLAVFVAEQIIDHNADPTHPPGIEGYKQHLQGVCTTFPDFQLTIEAQIAENDLVVTQVIGRGTHLGTWLNIQPRGTPIIVTGINIDRVIDGKIVEHWGEANTVGMLAQLGVHFFPTMKQGEDLEASTQ